MNIKNAKFITGLKVLSSCDANLIRILKKYRHDSISAIKFDLENQDYVLECNSVDLESYDQLLDCYDELTKNGYKSEVYEDDVVQDMGLVRNWSASMHETSDYINNQDPIIED